MGAHNLWRTEYPSRDGYQQGSITLVSVQKTWWFVDHLPEISSLHLHPLGALALKKKKGGEKKDLGYRKLRMLALAQSAVGIQQIEATRSIFTCASNFHQGSTVSQAEILFCPQKGPESGLIPGSSFQSYIPFTESLWFKLSKIDTVGPQIEIVFQKWLIDFQF